MMLSHEGHNRRVAKRFVVPFQLSLGRNDKDRKRFVGGPSQFVHGAKENEIQVAMEAGLDDDPRDEEFALEQVAEMRVSLARTAAVDKAMAPSPADTEATLDQ